MIDTLLCESRLNKLFEVMDSVPKGSGLCIYECGVWKGGSAQAIAERILFRKTRVKAFRCFDSFTGIKGASEKDNHHKDGDFSDGVSVESVRERLSGYSFVNVIQGQLPEALKPYQSDFISFAHVDVDVYEPTKGCLEFIWPRLVLGGAIVCDDYNAETCLGAKLACDEFLAITPNVKKRNGNQSQLIIWKGT